MSSKNTTQFPLLHGDFYTCSIRWDEESKQYTPADRSEIFSCCSNNCNIPYMDCINSCSEPICYESCNQRLKNCITNCNKSKHISDEDDPFITTTKKFSCWDYNTNTPKKSCLKNIDKQTFLSECKKQCSPSLYTDCDKFCELSLSSTLSNSIQHIQEYAIPRSHSSIIIYLLSAITFAIVILGIIVLTFPN
jgi:hypothetical protein